MAVAGGKESSGAACQARDVRTGGAGRRADRGRSGKGGGRRLGVEGAGYPALEVLGYDATAPPGLTPHPNREPARRRRSQGRTNRAAAERRPCGGRKEGGRDSSPAACGRMVSE